MKRLDPAGRARFYSWHERDIRSALSIIDEDAALCGHARLEATALNFLLQRLPPAYFANRSRREILSLNIKTSDFKKVYENVKTSIGRSAEHWIAMAGSPMEDPQEDAKLFATQLRLQNAYLWMLVGYKVCEINPGMERLFWRIQTKNFRPMSQ